MSFYLTALGSALLLLVAFLVGKGYAGYADEREREYEGFISLLEHLKEQLECYLKGGAAMLEGFFSDRLSALGFFEGEGDAPSRFERIKKRLTLDIDSRKLLERFFSALGSGYREVESERIDRTLDALRKKYNTYACEKEKNVKLVRVLLLAGAMGLIIFLI